MDLLTKQAIGTSQVIPRCIRLHSFGIDAGIGNKRADKDVLPQDAARGNQHLELALADGYRDHGLSCFTVRFSCAAA